MIRHQGLSRLLLCRLTHHRRPPQAAGSSFAFMRFTRFLFEKAFLRVSVPPAPPCVRVQDQEVPGRGT